MAKGPAVYLSVSGSTAAAAVEAARARTLTATANQQSGARPALSEEELALSEEELDDLARQRAQFDNIGGFDPEKRKIVLSAHELTK